MDPFESQTGWSCHGHWPRRCSPDCAKMFVRRSRSHLAQHKKGVATGRQGVATGRIDGSWILFKFAWWSVVAQACTFDTTPDRQTFVPTHANEDKTPQCARILRRHHSPFPCPSEVADLYRRRDGCGTRAGFLRKSLRQYFLPLLGSVARNTLVSLSMPTTLRAISCHCLSVSRELIRLTMSSEDVPS